MAQSRLVNIEKQKANIGLEYRCKCFELKEFCRKIYSLQFLSENSNDRSLMYQSSL